MIIITGASDGLGKQIAVECVKSRKKVVNISRNTCEIANINLIYDLSILSEVQKIVQEILAIDDPIEAIICNAGVYSETPIGKITSEELDKVLSTNVESMILLVSGLIERIKKDEADVLSVVSTAGTWGNPNHSVYAASKWAQRGFTQSLQNELKNTKSRVVSFCPGGMQTKLLEKNSGSDPTKDGTSWMDPVDVAKLIMYLLNLPKNIEVSEIIVNRKK